METTFARKNQQRHISTFVFFDLKSLWPHRGEQNKITELSMVAVDRVSLLGSPTDQLPRVVKKISIPVYPMSTVPSLVATFQQTGLDNSSLLYQKDFDKDLATLINIFLGRLYPPVCLVAHNGYLFDFPLIAKELTSISMQLTQTLLCVDSLVAFRAFDWLSLAPGAAASAQTTNETTPIKDKLTVNATLKRKRFSEDMNDSRTIDVKRRLFRETQASDSDECLSQDVRKDCARNDCSGETFYWPDLREIMNTPWEYVDEDLPRCASSSTCDDSWHQERAEVGMSSKGHMDSKSLKSGIVLSPKPNFGNEMSSGKTGQSVHGNTSKEKYKPVSMKLPDIHQFVVGRPPDSVRSAEDDCLSLVRIVQRTAKWFCSWTDQNARPFSSTKFKCAMKKSRDFPRGSFPYNHNQQTTPPSTSSSRRPEPPPRWKVKLQNRAAVVLVNENSYCLLDGNDSSL